MGISKQEALDVSVICTQRDYFSSYCDKIFLMNSLGKPLSEKCIVL